ncbi:(Fe-S)-binding protein [Candidatus Bathyarchaeota archaeon]|nr:(Fe-S)-binding protein [Candidatus Bathyarchaeota archaeon]MBS7630041.1 (Fe-S)-binding protein [Candidatus Bathyarchaeota archaeon]
MTKNGSKDLIENLIKIFGRENVLTELEDLYVYSHWGAFASKKRRLPVAVVRLRSFGEEEKLEELIGDSGFKILRLDQTISYLRESDASYIIVDYRKRQNPDHLAIKVRSRSREEEDKKSRLRGASSVYKRFVENLKNVAGYRLDENVDAEDGFCVVHRPPYDSETFSAKGRLTLLRGIFKGDLKPTSRLVESIFTCTACGQCYDQGTSEGFEINNAIIQARREIKKFSAAPKQSLTLLKNIQGLQNPFGMPTEDRDLWFEESVEEHPYKGNSILYWAGCSTAYRLPNIVESMVKVMEEAEVDFGLLGKDEGCCGLILYLLGFWDEAEENARRIVNKLNSLKVREVVTSCAGCFYMFSRVFKNLDVDFRFNIRHSSQIIESLILKGFLHLETLKGSYVWHDPCDLGRHSGVYEPPRRVLKSISDLVLKEQTLNKQHTLCCGAGGGLWMYNSGLAESIAQLKIEEAINRLKVDGLVTGCPNCILSLRNVAGSKLPVLDISELVAMIL